MIDIPAAGIEPARPRGHRILSPARLPVPPRRHDIYQFSSYLLTLARKAVTGFEPVMKVLQTYALPLGYTAIKTGLAGFEPTMTESKSVALPLGYSPKMGRLMGLEPTNAGSTNRCVNPFATIAKISI